jgi:hypothetical protein
VNTTRRREKRTVWLAPIALLAAGLAAAPAVAQVASEGKGTLTIQVGQASAPFGGIAAAVADPGVSASRDSLHALAFRFAAGYHFAEQVSAEVAVGHLGTMNSYAPYNGTDVLNVQTSLLVVEGDLIANIPIAPDARIDFTGGIAETGLQSSITTQAGSALPVGQNASDNVRRFGVTAGADLEWRLGDVTSVLVGYHLYTHVGSSVLRDSASGNVGAIFGGVRFQF